MEQTKDVTTIKLAKATKKRLDKLKAHKRETYDDILQDILKILNLCKSDPYEAKTQLQRIDFLRARFEEKEKAGEKAN